MHMRDSTKIKDVLFEEIDQNLLMPQVSIYFQWFSHHVHDQCTLRENLLVWKSSYNLKDLGIQGWMHLDPGDI